MIIKIFNDNSYVEYSKGKFDEYCIYFTSNGVKIAPLDLHYFERLKDLGNIYGHQKVYNDFVKIYNMTDKDINQDVLDYIDNLSIEYKENSLLANQIFTILYMGMISEENYPHAKIGKRMKRLGAYEVLITKAPILVCINFMKGMKWREIDKLCKEKGF